jgi:LPXTG-motif cell wall-anchored protein
MNTSTMILVGVLSVLVVMYLLRRKSRLSHEDID